MFPPLYTCVRLFPGAGHGILLLCDHQLKTI